MDMSKTLSDLPTDLHRLILSHDEEKLELKKENEKLKTVLSRVTYMIIQSNWYNKHTLDGLYDEDILQVHYNINKDEDKDSEHTNLAWMYSPLIHLTCDELKKRLRTIKKPVGGRKAVLIERLREHEAVTEKLLEDLTADVLRVWLNAE